MLPPQLSRTVIITVADTPSPFTTLVTDAHIVKELGGALLIRHFTTTGEISLATNVFDIVVSSKTGPGGLVPGSCRYTAPRRTRSNPTHHAEFEENLALFWGGRNITNRDR